ncbi:MAG: MotA/TolQ/ExbB proton channel family protein [Alphaproteobacteria bacterium]
MFDQALTTALDFLELGGPVVTLLVALSVLSFAIVLVKFWQFWTLRVGRHGPVHKAMHFWSLNNRSKAHQSLVGQSGVLSALVARTMYLLEQRGENRDDAEEVLTAQAMQSIHRLQSGFRALDSIAQIAPLLGLFGTVLGMIEAFQKLQGAGSSVDPSLLAGGIWVALLTTAVGLAVAMPTSLCLTYFESRVANERMEMESALVELFNPGLQFSSQTDRGSSSFDTDGVEAPA